MWKSAIGGNGSECSKIKLENILDEEIHMILGILKEKKLKVLSGASGERMVKKFRHVDPKFLVGGQLARLSEIDSSSLQTLDRYKKINAAGRIVSDVVRDYA